jgi:serine protease Do
MRSRLLVLTLATLLGAGCGPTPAPAQTQREVPVSRQAIQLSFAPVVRRVAPAVVNITSRKEVRVRNPFLDDPFFEFFFRDFGGFGREQRQVQQSLGSGVILSGDGLIVTNDHVVGDADAIEVVLADRRSFSARLVARDERSDLAFLRVDPGGERLPAVEIGNSDAIEVGDLVLAVGNPFGIGQTVTSGIISATARTAPQLDRDVSFLQTDAAINPGNSGGALVDTQGRLIGINTAIFSRGGGSIGIGFAIPSSLVTARMAGLAGARGGEVARPWLGARIQAVDAALAESLGLNRPVGVVINRVHPGGPADRAGIRAGDVVLAIDGVEVDDPAALGFRLSLLPVGRTAELAAMRRGRELTARLPIEAPREEPPAQVTRLDRSSPLDGATVANLSPALNERLGRDLLDSGVIVLEIRPRSRARAMRLRPGDVLTRVNGRAIASVAELERALDDGTLRRLDLSRDGRQLVVTIG